MKEEIIYSCPCCGHKSSVENLFDPQAPVFQVQRKTFGGKRAYTEAEKRMLAGVRVKRGGAPGVMTFEDIDTPPKVQEAIEDRLSAALIQVSGTPGRRQGKR